VGEALPEFGGEEERRICSYALDPRGGVFRADGLVERSVDFDGVEKLGEEACFVKILWAAGGIDEAGPVWVRQAGGADEQAAMGR